MKITQEIKAKVIDLDRRYRSSWDARAIAHTIGGISHQTAAAILKEARGPRPKKTEVPHVRRTRFLFRDIMWSSDFVRLPDGRLLLKTQDEASRYRLGWNPSPSESAEAVRRHAEDIVHRMGRVPLIWKYDHGSGFVSDLFQEFLEEKKIIPYPTQPRAPWTNGRVERDHQEILNWLLAVEELGLTLDQWDREIDEGMMTLNFIKPRAVLEFKTSTETYFNMPGLDNWSETDRLHFCMNVEDLKTQIALINKESVHRKAVRTALQEWKLYEEWEIKPKEAGSVNRSEIKNVAN